MYYGCLILEEFQRQGFCKVCFEGLQTHDGALCDSCFDEDPQSPGSPFRWYCPSRLLEDWCWGWGAQYMCGREDGELHEVKSLQEESDCC